MHSRAVAWQLGRDRLSLSVRYDESRGAYADEALSANVKLDMHSCWSAYTYVVQPQTWGLDLAWVPVTSRALYAEPYAGHEHGLEVCITKHDQG